MFKKTVFSCLFFVFFYGSLFGQNLSPQSIGYLKSLRTKFNFVKDPNCDSKYPQSYFSKCHNFCPSCGCRLQIPKSYHKFSFEIYECKGCMGCYFQYFAPNWYFPLIPFGSNVNLILKTAGEPKCEEIVSKAIEKLNVIDNRTISIVDFEKEILKMGDKIRTSEKDNNDKMIEEIRIKLENANTDEERDTIINDFKAKTISLQKQGIIFDNRRQIENP